MAAPSYVRNLTLDGFTYGCRTLENSKPTPVPMVILRGAYQDMNSFRKFEARWRAVATVMIVELPGTGSDTELPLRYGFDFLAEALRHLHDEMGTESIWLGCPTARPPRFISPRLVLTRSRDCSWSGPLRISPRR
jgi:hypothetical protein